MDSIGFIWFKNWVSYVHGIYNPWIVRPLNCIVVNDIYIYIYRYRYRLYIDLHTIKNMYIYILSIYIHMYVHTHSLHLPYISCIVKVAAIGGRSAAKKCGAHGPELWMEMPFRWNFWLHRHPYWHLLTYIQYVKHI